MKLADDIRHRRVDPRTLSPATRKALVELMADGSMSAKDLAGFLGTTTIRVQKDLGQIRKKLGAGVMAWSVGDAVGYLAAAAEACYAKAYENGDGVSAMSIRSNFVRQLKELGVIAKDDARDGVRVTIETMGHGLARATEALERAFRPELSGEQRDPRLVDSTAAPVLELPVSLVEDELVQDVHVEDAQ